MAEATPTWLQEIRQYWRDYVAEYERRTGLTEATEARRDSRLNAPGPTRPAARQSA